MRFFFFTFKVKFPASAECCSSFTVKLHNQHVERVSTCPLNVWHKNCNLYCVVKVSNKNNNNKKQDGKLTKPSASYLEPVHLDVRLCV